MQTKSNKPATTTIQLLPQELLERVWDWVSPRELYQHVAFATRSLRFSVVGYRREHLLRLLALPDNAVKQRHFANLHVHLTALYATPGAHDAFVSELSLAQRMRLQAADIKVIRGSTNEPYVRFLKDNYLIRDIFRSFDGISRSENDYAAIAHGLLHNAKREVRGYDWLLSEPLYWARARLFDAYRDWQDNTIEDHRFWSVMVEAVEYHTPQAVSELVAWVLERLGVSDEVQWRGLEAFLVRNNVPVPQLANPWIVGWVLVERPVPWQLHRDSPWPHIHPLPMLLGDSVGLRQLTDALLLAHNTYDFHWGITHALEDIGLVMYDEYEKLSAWLDEAELLWRITLLAGNLRPKFAKRCKTVIRQLHLANMSDRRQLHMDLLRLADDPEDTLYEELVEFIVLDTSSEPLPLLRQLMELPGAQRSRDRLLLVSGLSQEEREVIRTHPQ